MAAPSSASLTALKLQAKWGYRRLIKVSRTAFKDDSYAISSARTALRENFAQSKNETDIKKIRQLVKGIDDVEEMFRLNIVQGKQNEHGTYQVKLSDPQKKNMRQHEEIHTITQETGPEDLTPSNTGCCQIK